MSSQNKWISLVIIKTQPAYNEMLDQGIKVRGRIKVLAKFNKSYFHGCPICAKIGLSCQSSVIMLLMRAMPLL